jgi:ABC-type uncharacterized transport system YnjBCD substrate-binding protein
MVHVTIAYHMLHCKNAGQSYLPVTFPTIEVPMSKQLAISAAFSVFAMAAFALTSTPLHTVAGAKANASAPAFRLLPASR